MFATRPSTLFRKLYISNNSSMRYNATVVRMCARTYTNAYTIFLSSFVS